jgi:hypothetical protein
MVVHVPVCALARGRGGRRGTVSRRRVWLWRRRGENPAQELSVCGGGGFPCSKETEGGQAHRPNERGCRGKVAATCAPTNRVCPPSHAAVPAPQHEPEVDKSAQDFCARRPGHVHRLQPGAGGREARTSEPRKATGAATLDDGRRLRSGGRPGCAAGGPPAVRQAGDRCRYGHGPSHTRATSPAGCRKLGGGGQSPENYSFRVSSAGTAGSPVARGARPPRTDDGQAEQMSFRRCRRAPARIAVEEPPRRTFLALRHRRRRPPAAHWSRLTCASASPQPCTTGPLAQRGAAARRLTRIPFYNRN